MTNIKQQYDETDLAVFPPYMSRFIFVIILLVISHASFVLLISQHIFYVDVSTMIIGGMLTTLVIVFCNIAITRGHAKFVKVLVAIALLYILTGTLSGILGILMIYAFPIELVASTFIFSALALTMMKLPGYRTCVGFLEKRWALYRATGETVAEAMAKKKQK